MLNDTFVSLNFDKTAEDTREVDVDGQKFTVVRKDPFGHYFISVSKGPLPDKLKGAFTSHVQAQKAIEGFVNG